MKLISDANSACSKPKYLILDASAITFCDKTGALTIAELAEELLQENVTMLIASSSSQLREICENCNVIPSSLFYPTVYDAVLSVTQKQPLNFTEIRYL
uniref:STAS domain-containing protein n=1 Tax=Acrobeloides nanus TaxID=290746 RepID=A0A914EF41_9BILA